MLQVRHEKLELLVQFSSYAYQGDQKECKRLYERMQKLSMGLTLRDIRYYITELSYTVTLSQRELELQKELVVADNCEIHEDIVLYEGMILTFDHTTVRIFGNIVLMGGELRILHSKMIKKNENSRSCIQVKRDAILYIQNSSFECRNHGMAIKQEQGELTILSSCFMEASAGAAVRFWGRQVQIRDCVFEDCYSPEDGGAILINGGQGSIEECQFHHCEAKRGGAICCHEDIEIRNCTFYHCRAEKYGSAVYGLSMLEDGISGLVFKECIPRDMAVTQYIGGKGNIHIKSDMHIGISSILDCKIVVEDTGSLTIENAVLIVNIPLLCKGRIFLKKVHMIAGYIKEQDMLVLQHAKECSLSAVKVDGACKSGGIHAGGSRLSLKRCVFRNTVQGRAVFDAYQPVINACIFNFCQDGAILCQGGTISNCMFINCRSSNGAGIILKGRGGTVQSCTFKRCVAEYRDGAIRAIGSHTVEHCSYENCKP